MSIKTQRKIRRVHATMGVRTMGLDAEDEHRICIGTRAKPGATVVPHKKWVRGAWHNENGELVSARALQHPIYLPIQMCL